MQRHWGVILIDFAIYNLRENTGLLFKIHKIAEID